MRQGLMNTRRTGNFPAPFAGDKVVSARPEILSTASAIQPVRKIASTDDHHKPWILRGVLPHFCFVFESEETRPHDDQGLKCARDASLFHATHSSPKVSDTSRWVVFENMGCVKSGAPPKSPLMFTEKRRGRIRSTKGISDGVESPLKRASQMPDMTGEKVGRFGRYRLQDRLHRNGLGWPGIQAVPAKRENMVEERLKPEINDAVGYKQQSGNAFWVQKSCRFENLALQLGWKTRGLQFHVIKSSMSVMARSGIAIRYHAEVKRQVVQMPDLNVAKKLFLSSGDSVDSATATSRTLPMPCLSVSTATPTNP
ncbi:hypothetical protein C8J57DRAFT_1259415 [Mycena rebaudengoi]|nr:hypothetical protein C8J57DRAFT_1259415 [Mycena rebaudengoi]